MSNRTPVELLSVLLTARVAAVVGDGGVPEGVLLVLREGLLVAVRHGAGALLELGLQQNRQENKRLNSLLLLLLSGEVCLHR